MRRCLALAAAVLLSAVFVAAAAAERITVDVDMGNVRSGPGTSYEVIWRVERNHPLTVIKRSGDWYYFRDFEGDKGWIHRSIISSRPAVIVVKNSCNIRSGPGTNHDIAFIAERGVPFIRKATKGKWINVLHEDGESGWIHKSLVW
ncbi:MAG: hypothetical protein CSB33_02720 [Desulfobacterales bacterium]|nr:MAG: hypothetical protein CSB33_02720 [Desulfobacterales bacterium]